MVEKSAEFVEDEQKQLKTVLDSYVIDRVKIQNKNHFESCNCCKEEFKKIYQQKLLEEKQKLNNVIDITENAKQERLSRVPKKTAEILTQVVEGKVCPYEYDELMGTVNIFRSKYDLNDPRVFSIIKTLLDIQLTAYRMQRESEHYGILLSEYDKNDNPKLVINPVEEIKRRYNETYIKTIEALNKMMDGEKHLHLHGVKVFDRDELYNDLQ